MQKFIRRVDGVDFPATYSAIVNAVNYSPNLFVLNNSWDLIDDNNNPGLYSIVVRQAFAYAYKANRTSIASMGNHQINYPNVTAYPAGFDNVIAVGATNNLDDIAYFSAHGNHIDVVAPGVGILSTSPNNSYATNDGTSFAAPFVSGVASLLKGFRPQLANDDIENVIRLSADDLGNTGFDAIYGMGRVNAERALNLLRPPYTLNQWSSTGGTITGSPTNIVIQILGASGLSSANYTAKRYEVRKSVSFPAQFCNIIGAWGRGVSTTGWSMSSPNYGEGFCEIVPGTLTNSSVTLRTYVYELWSSSGSYLGYYPTTANNVTFSYTVLGTNRPSSSISGPSLVCGSGGTFIVSNIPTGWNLSWNKSSNLNLNSSNENSAVFSSNEDGQGWVQAILKSPTCSLTLQKDVWVGIPPYPVITSNQALTIYVSNDIYLHDINTETFGSLIQDFQWTWDSDGVCCLYDMTPGYQMYYGAYPGTVRIRTNVTNECGSTNWSEPVFVEVIEEMNLSPNPASEMIDVTIPERPETSGSINENYNVRILTSSGLVVYSGKKDSRKFNLSVANLQNGTYIIEIINNKKIYKKQFVVKH